MSASQSDRLRPAGTTASAAGVAAARARAGGLSEVRIVAHSNMLYWWVVWVYGYICAMATHINHIGVTFGAKVIKFHPSAWLGLSFVLLVLFVIVFTNVRARVVHTVLVLSIMALIAIGVNWSYGLERIFHWVPELLVQMNLAFYMVFSTALMLLWLVVVFGIDKLTLWRFSHGQVIEMQRLGHATDHVYDTRGMIMRRLPGDFFRHKILGLGTGDLMFRPAARGADPFILENVWKVNDKQRRIERLITASAGSG